LTKRGRVETKIKEIWTIDKNISTVDMSIRVTQNWPIGRLASRKREMNILTNRKRERELVEGRERR